MATGYTTRPGGRTSFADQGIDPVQTTTGASGESRGVQAVGGETIGGVEGGMETNPGQIAAGVGQFFEHFLAPEIERKQRAQFFKGFTEAQSGRALDELTDNDSPLTKMFGPSGFAQGAQYFTGQAAINKWQQAQIADMENLRQLPPEELAKHLSSSIQEHLTGDEFADAHIQAGFFEAQGPLIQLHAKQRYAWQQDTARRAVSEAGNSAASSLQQIVQAQASLGEGADTEAVRMAAQRFMGSMSKPEGMADETYKEFLYDFMRNNMAEGNFYAVSLLREQGIGDVFDDEQREKLENAYERYGDRALDKAIGQDVLARMLVMDARIEQTKMGSPDGITVKDIVAEYQGINRLLRERTGVDKDYFDIDEIISAGGEVNSAFTSAYLRQLRRAEQLEDREFERQTAFQVAEREAQARVQLAQSAWENGQINAFEVAGGKVSDINAAAMSDFSQGEYSRIANAYTQSSFVSTPVKKQIEALSRSGIGSEYTKATDKAYRLWRAFNDINPELADAYFGDFSAQFEVFDQATGTVGPEAAFREAFGNGSRGGRKLSGDALSAFNSEFNDIFAENSSAILYPWRWGNYTLNDQGKQELRRALYNQVANRASTSSRSVEELTRQAYNGAIRDGRFEQYGVFGWANGRATTPLSKMLGLQRADSHRVVQGAILQTLKRIGVTDASGVSVIRTKSGLALSYEGGDGFPETTHLTNDELRAYANSYVKTKKNRIRDKDVLADPQGGTIFSL